MSYEGDDPIDMGPEHPDWPKKPDGTPLSAGAAAAVLRGRGQTPGQGQASAGRSGGGARRSKSDGPGDEYVEVKERIQQFYATYPTGALVTSKVVPFADGEIDDKPRIMVQALAYRTPDDPHPGVGTSWMVLPGRTPYTNGSELENVETSAWGRAIAAVGILVDKGIASAQEIRMKEGGDIEPPSRTNADALRAAAEVAAGSGSDADMQGDLPIGTHEQAAPDTGRTATPPSGAPAPPAPEQVTAVPDALPGESAEAPSPAAAVAETPPGLDYDEFRRLSREKFIPNGHIATTARDLVERGEIPQVGGVKELTDQQRLTLFMAALARMDDKPQEAQ